MRKKSVARIGLGCVGLFALFCLTYCNQMASPLKAATTPPPGKGTIYGLLTQHDGKTVVPNATVQLLTVPGMGQMPVLVGTTNTDTQGTFKFEGLAPGEYNAQATWLSYGVAKKTHVKKGQYSHIHLSLPKETVPPKAPKTR